MLKIRKLLLALSFFASLSYAQVQTYQVVTPANYAPFTMIDEKGNIEGFDIDLIRTVAEDHNFQVEFYYQIPEKMLADNRPDIYVNGLAATEIDPEYFNTTIPYIHSPNCLAALDERFLEDNWQTHLIAVSSNEVLGENLEEKFNAHNLIRTNTPFLSLREVVLKNANIAGSDCNVYLYYSKSPTFTNKNLHFKLLELEGEAREDTDLVYGVRKTNLELLTQINTTITQMKQDGRYDALLKKWKIDREFTLTP